MSTLVKMSNCWKSNAAAHMATIKGVKKFRSAIKLCFYYFSHYVSNDINVTGIL